jgi:hypothetical protein
VKRDFSTNIIVSPAVSAAETTGSAVLFLDTDVLRMSSHHSVFDVIAAVHGRHIAPQSVYKGLFQPLAVAALKRVHCAMAARITYVITSTWRELLTRDQFDSVLRESGLGFVAERLHEGDAWRSPQKLRCGLRVHEISQWLDQNHRSEPFAILDDIWSGSSLLPAVGGWASPVAHSFVGRVVLWRKDVGENDGQMLAILSALRRPLRSAGEVGLELAA